MMEDLAMHLMEILINSISAGAKRVILFIRDSVRDDVIEITVKDDGKGMSKEMAERVASPFTTSRTTRKVGLGLAFLSGLCEMCNGKFELESELGVGTTVNASIQKSHLDAPMMGDIGNLIMTAVQSGKDCEIEFHYKTDNDEFVFTTDEVKETLDGVSILEPEVLIWIKDYVNQQIHII